MNELNLDSQETYDYIKSVCLNNKNSINSHVYKRKEIYILILSALKERYGDLELSELLHLYLNKKEKPYCGCGAPLRFYGIIDGYGGCILSYKCNFFIQKALLKRKETVLSLYGADNVSKVNSIHQKKVNTYILKYGVDNPSKSKVIQGKKIETSIKNWGVLSPNQSPIVHQKKIETSIKNWGTNYPMESDAVKKLSIEGSILKYGVSNVSKSDVIKQKRITTFMINYGVDNPSKSQKIKLKMSKSISIARAKHYQERHINGICAGNVYIIYFEHLDSYKVGVSTNLSYRFEQLKLCFGNFKVVQIYYTFDCYGLEKEIHNNLQDFRSPIEIKESGYTEFFKLDLYKFKGRK